MSWEQIRAEWLQWWSGLSLFRKVFPAALFVAYWSVMLALGGLRPDLAACSLIPTVLFYLGPKVRTVHFFILPFFLTAIVYDSQRYYAEYIRGEIHVTEPYWFDKFFFGIGQGEARLTPNEWWQLHTNVVLDFFCGIAYIIFIPVYIVTAAIWQFYYSKKGTYLRHPRSIAYRSPQVMWAFFFVNVIGYSTYYWYPASPPWYVAEFGFGPARLDVPASLAGCARFDALIGWPLFKNWYGHSADVHGAIPSLHIAYPLMSVYYAFRFGALKAFTVFFYVLMCFSAVYLNHHYILDILWGSAYAIIVALGTDLTWNWWLKRKGVIIPGP